MIEARNSIKNKDHISEKANKDNLNNMTKLNKGIPYRKYLENLRVLEKYVNSSDLQKWSSKSGTNSSSFISYNKGSNTRIIKSKSKVKNLGTNNSDLS